MRWKIPGDHVSLLNNSQDHLKGPRSPYRQDKERRR